MTKMVLIEPSMRQSDARPVTIEGRVWDAMCRAARNQGFAVSNETIGPIEASLFAAAVRRAMAQKEPSRGLRGSERFIVAEPSVLNDVQGKVSEVLSLLDAGGVVITKRTW